MHNTRNTTGSLGGAPLVHVAFATSVLLLAGYSCRASPLASTLANETIRIRLQQHRPHGSLVRQLRECHCLNKTNQNFYYRLSDTNQYDDVGDKIKKDQCNREACHLAMRALTFKPYTAQIQLGTPPQLFEVLFDTGSDVIWVPHSECRLNGNLWQSGFRRKFAVDESSTFKRVNQDRVRLRYANQMEFDGWWIQDTIMISDSHDDSRSLTVPNQALALICFIKGGANHYDDGFDGLIGLGFRTSNSKNSNTLIENMLLNGFLKEPVFSFYSSHTSTEDCLAQLGTSELVFGQIDPALYTGPITWTPVTKLPYWEIRLHSIKLMPRETVQGPDAHEPAAVACVHGCEAAVDTGTSLLVGPATEISRLNEKLGFVPNGNGNDLFVAQGPCIMHVDQDLLLVFEINGVQLELEAQQFMFDVDEGGVRVCLSALSSHSRGQERLPWILGAPFVSSFYTIFDYGHKRVGFAKPAIAAPAGGHNNDGASSSSQFS